jgi:NAD(P)-dependent dehydrogenase (short-subunit alcohol dehydrogenase family)
LALGLFDLTGKVVLASGSNSGIGLGFLQGCAKQGADVVVWGRRADKNAQAAAKLKQMGARRTYSEEVDVSDAKAVAAAFAASVKAMGRIDCVFANAGFMTRAPSVMELGDEMYHNLINVNQHGAFYLLREAARHMKARADAGDPGGSIVACGSLSIFQGLQGMEHYAAAKGAVAAIIKSIAAEMGKYGVRANMIAPGFIITGFMEESSPQTEAVIKHYSGVTPLGRVGYIEDIEGPAAYLASDASRYHTGDILVVDGGWMVNSP